MPQRNRGSRRRGNKRNKSAFTAVVASSALDPFPDIFETTLKYSGQYNFSVALGVSVNRFFSGNGLYDPDISGTGKQPYSFDTFCGAPGGIALYKRYAVLGSTFHSDDYVGTSSVGVPAGIFVLRPEGDAAGTTDSPDDLIQKSRATWGVHSNPGSPHPRLVDSASTAEILGVSQNAWQIDDTLQGDNTKNPDRQWYWHWCVTSPDYAASVTGVHTFVIEYTIRFISRNRLGNS